MRRWYYENGAGLLLSDDTQALWAKIRASLEKKPPVKHLAVWSAMSLLRTELKLDLQVGMSVRRLAEPSERRPPTDLERLAELRKRSATSSALAFVAASGNVMALDGLWRRHQLAVFVEADCPRVDRSGSIRRGCRTSIACAIASSSESCSAASFYGGEPVGTECIRELGASAVAGSFQAAGNARPKSACLPGHGGRDQERSLLEATLAGDDPGGKQEPVLMQREQRPRAATPGRGAPGRGRDRCGRRSKRSRPARGRDS